MDGIATLLEIMRNRYYSRQSRLCDYVFLYANCQNRWCGVRRAVSFVVFLAFL